MIKMENSAKIKEKNERRIIYKQNKYLNNE